MRNGIPVLRFVYQYVTIGELADETIEVEATSERDAHTKARAKLDRNGLKSIGLRLASSEPTGSVRSVAEDDGRDDAESEADYRRREAARFQAEKSQGWR